MCIVVLLLMNQTCSLYLDCLYNRNKSTQRNKLISNGEQRKEVSFGDETVGIYIWKPESWWKRLTGKRCLRQPAQDKLWELQRMTASQPRNPASSEGGSPVPACFLHHPLPPSSPPSHVVSTGNWPLPSGKSKQAPDSSSLNKLDSSPHWRAEDFGHQRYVSQ